MGFEVFIRPKPGRVSGPVMLVRVAKEAGQLHLNRLAYVTLGEPKYVLLWRDGDSIGISASGKREEAFAAANGNISCRPFIDAVGLMPGSKLPLRKVGEMLRTDGKQSHE